MLAIFYILLIFIGANLGIYSQQFTVQAAAPVVIPDEAIRLRILANSDSDEDQALKRLIRDEVNDEITKWVDDLTSIDVARTIIQDRLKDIEAIIADVLKRQKIDENFTVDFGNVDFPTKMYGNYIYPAGEYEAILITIGDGKGANWWCVLFPPLCFLDFSNGEASVENQEESTGDQTEKVVSDKKEEVKMKIFIVEFFKSLF